MKAAVSFNISFFSFWLMVLLVYFSKVAQIFLQVCLFETQHIHAPQLVSHLVKLWGFFINLCYCHKILYALVFGVKSISSLSYIVYACHNCSIQNFMMNRILIFIGAALIRGEVLIRERCLFEIRCLLEEIRQALLLKFT